MKISARTEQLIDRKTNSSPYQTKLISSGLLFYFYGFLCVFFFFKVFGIGEVEFGEGKVPVSYRSSGFAGRHTCAVGYLERWEGKGELPLGRAAGRGGGSWGLKPPKAAESAAGDARCGDWQG